MWAAGVRFPNHLLPEVRTLLQAAQDVAQNAKVRPLCTHVPVHNSPCKFARPGTTARPTAAYAGRGQNPRGTTGRKGGAGGGGQMARINPLHSSFFFECAVLGSVQLYPATEM